MNYSPSWESNSWSASREMPCFLWNLNFCCCINKTLYNLCDRKIGNMLATVVEFLARHRIPSLEDRSLSSGHSCWCSLSTTDLFIQMLSPSYTARVYVMPSWNIICCGLCVFSRYVPTRQLCLFVPHPLATDVWLNLMPCWYVSFFVCCVEFDVYLFRHFTPHHSKSVLFYF